MRSLYKILEGILDANFDYDIPKEVEEIVKLCQPLKFEEDQRYGGKTVYRCKRSCRTEACESLNKIIALTKKLPEVPFRKYLDDSSVTLLGANEEGIILGVPTTDDVMGMHSQNVHRTGRVTYLHLFKDDATGRLGFANEDMEMHWYVLPVESYSIIKAAIFK